MKKIFCFTVALVIAGCASTSANLQSEAARSIGDVAPDTVQVKNVSRGVSTVTWDAVSSKGAYKCSADDMVRRVLCVKKD